METERGMESQTVEDLLTLQEMDAEITRVRAEMSALEEERGFLEQRLVELERREGEAAARLEREDAAVRATERTVNAGRATLKRLQARTLEVHNMREHAAVRAEVDAARQNLDLAETNLLEAMQGQERARGEVKAIADEALSTRAETAERIAELEARYAALTDQLHIQRDRRQNKALRIDDTVRSLYDRVRGGRTTRALAPVVDGVCGSCFTSIPLQRQAEIRSGRRLIVCEACGVILHAER